MIVVTGGSGQAERACVRDLMEHGLRRHLGRPGAPADPKVRFSRADVTHFGEAVAAAVDDRRSGSPR